MAREQPIELFMPPNMLKAKVGGGLGGIDLSAVRRAEAAMETLSAEFSDWVAEDVAKLMVARGRYAEKPGVETRNALLLAAHDIKGQAATFHFPLIARVAGSLARLLESDREIPAALVDAHVNAVQVIHRQGLHETDNRVAQTLCAELDARVSEVLAQK